MREQKGITLIALVITIIILIILATVSVNIIFSDEGILERARSAEKMQKMAEEQERLELIKPIVAMDNEGKVTVDKYIEELIKQGIINENEVKENEDGSKQVTTDNGYSVNIKEDEENENNIIITVEGETGDLKPRITKIAITSETNGFKVKVDVLRGERATYNYYYKLEGETTYTLYNEEPVTDVEYTIDGLEQNANYDIKVEVINESGTSFAEAKGRTGAVGDAEGALEFVNLTWDETDHTASIAIQKNTEDDSKIQYKIDTGEYKEIEPGEEIPGLTLGQTVTVRLWDGTNGGNPATFTVEDKENPNEANISLSETTTSGSITATVTQSDGESGIDLSKSKWVLNQDPSEEIEESDYPAENTFNTETNAEISTSATESGTYYLHVLTVDKAGNKVQTVSDAITVNQSVTQITLNKRSTEIFKGSTETLVATVLPDNASNKSVTWSSSATSIATVSADGTVTGKALGEATITATAQDGSGVSASCVVTVASTTGPNGKQVVNSITTTDHGTIDAEDRLGNPVRVPGGFKVVEGKLVQDGIVIADSAGNQFVWIPVSNIDGGASSSYNKPIKLEHLWAEEVKEVEITLGRYEFDIYSDCEANLVQLGSQWSDPTSYGIDSGSGDYYYELSEAREANDLKDGGQATNSTYQTLQAFIESVKKYHGYYIARYEASYASGSGYGLGSSYYKPASIISKSTSGDLVPGKLWYNMQQGEASKLARNMYYGNTYVVSDLVNSYMWDTAILFVQTIEGANIGISNYPKFAKANNKTGKIANTGETTDVRCNIYDMAGNLSEWTTEYHAGYGIAGQEDLPCIYRGGEYYSSAWTATREEESNKESWNPHGVRVSLYVK